MNGTELASIVSGQLSFIDAIDSGVIIVKGDLAQAKKFASYFESIDQSSITLSIPVNHADQTEVFIQ